MKSFKIPNEFRSDLITYIKEKKKSSINDYQPIKIDLGEIEFVIPSHFGFCFGVENALEIAYKTIFQNPGKRIFLLSEMIHNPDVNRDLMKKGIRFIFDESKKQNILWEELTPDDIVIIPAFGVSVEIEKILSELGVDVTKYNTTCPFVKRVWKRAAELGKNNSTIVIHGKFDHEETKATFSHASLSAKSLIIRDYEEAVQLCKIITGEILPDDFYKIFNGKFSHGFDATNDLFKIGVVNQTTMLASETEKISKCLRLAMIKKYGEEEIDNHFYNTRETLCYATNNNQTATEFLLNEDADFAIVVGGYNSSNTSHIAELLNRKFNLFFIDSSEKIIDKNEIKHYDLEKKSEIITRGYLPSVEKLRIIITSGASCPDSTIENVLLKILSLVDKTKDINYIYNKLI